MTFAFLCHSSSDKQIVEELAKRLVEQNIFYDKWDLDAGDLLPAKLSEAIYESRWFILLASKKSMASRWVKFELNVALRKWIEDENYRIVVAKIDDCEIHRELTPFLYIDCPNEPETAIERIVKLVLSEGRGVLGPRIEWRREIVDRYSEMEAIEKLSYEGIRFVFLWGHYGIGKSTLAEHAARQVFKSRITRFPLTDGHDLLRITLELASRAKSPLPPPTASEKELLSSVWDSINQLSRQGYIVFFDEVQLALNDDGTLRNFLLLTLKTISDLKDIPPIFLATNHYPQIFNDLKEKSHIMKVEPLKNEHMLYCLERWIKLAAPTTSIPERASLNRVVEHLYGYPLAARFASYLIIKYSVDAVLNDLRYFKNLRVDMAKQLLGRTKQQLSSLESSCLEALTIADTGLSLSELSEALETNVEELGRAIDNLYSALMITIERGRLQIIPIAKDYFWTRSYPTGKWKEFASKLVKNARYELTRVKPESEDFVHFCSRAYRLLVLLGRYDEAQQMAYYFKGELREAARRLYHAKEYELSLRYADLWLEINSNDNLIKWLRARCLTRLDRYSEAENTLKELEKTNFSRYMIHHAWGLMQRQKGDIEQALVSFKRGLDDRPAYVPLLRDYGDALEQSGDIKGALRVLKQAYDLAPRDPYVVPKLVALLEKDGRIKEALSLIEGFVVAFPEEAAFQHRISMLYSELEDNDKAYEHARNAVELDETLYEAVMHLAALEIKHDDLGEAEKLIEKLPTKLSFAQSRIRDTVLAELKLRKMNFEAARTVIKRYDLEKDPFCADVMGRIELSEASMALSKGQEKLALEMLTRGKNLVQKASQRFPENIPLKSTLDQLIALEKQIGLK